MPSPMPFTHAPVVRFSLRTWLLALWLLAMLPLLLFSASTGLELENRQRTATLEDLRHLSNNLLGSANERLNVAFSALDTLASSDAARRNDLPGLYEHARRVVLRNPWFLAATLVDARDQTLFLTTLPYGSKATPANYASLVHQVFATGRPNVSGPFAIAAHGQSVVAVSVPVHQNNKIAYCLRLLLLTDSVNRLLAGHDLPPGWVASIVDRQGTVVARAPAPEQFVGQKATASFMEGMRRPETAVFEALTPQGTAVTYVVRPILYGDWYLGLGVPNDVLNTPQRALRMRWGWFALAWLLLSALLAELLARYLSNQTGAVTAAVQRGATPSAVRLRVRELGDIVDAALARRGSGDGAPGTSVHALDEHAPCGYHTLDAEGRIVQINQTELGWLGRTAEQVLGQPFQDFMSAAGKAAFLAQLPLFVEFGQLQDLECELVRQDGSTLDVAISASTVRNASGQLLMSRVTVLDITERKQLQAALEQLARTDALTGLSNRRDFYQQAERELARCKRFHEPLSMLLLDIDQFKRINDRFGHAHGDEILKALGQSCRRQLRTLDIACRWGGEEFAVLMPETAAAGALDVARRLQLALSEVTLALADGQAISVTVSIGVCSLADTDASVDDLLKRTELALHQAQQQGRGQLQQALPPEDLDRSG